MYNDYKILILEDNEPDVFLAEREIKKIFNNYILETVDNKGDFVNSILNFSPDLIISDYLLPSFNGLEALIIAKKELPLTPFVILTGSMNEDTAVECMKAGADDYVLKEHIMLLNTSLQNAIRKKKMESEQKEANRALTESERHYRALFENSPVPLYQEDYSDVIKKIKLLKKEGVTNFRQYFTKNPQIILEYAKLIKILEFNKAALDLHGAKTKKELKNDLYKILSDDESEAFKEGVIAIAEGRVHNGYEGVAKTLDGKKKFVRVNWAIVPGYEKTFEKVYVSTIDISQRKRVEEELIKAKEDAEKADRLKSIFLAQMSHEIRTPINAMLSLTSLLKDDTDQYINDDQKMSFDLIGKAGERIVRTVDLLLNLSEIQAGTYEPILKPFNLYSDVLSNLMVKFKKFAKEKGLHLSIKVETDDMELVADSYTVNQIFEQLLDNSIKFTNSGTIDLNLRKDNQKLIVEVIDTGIGISKEYLSNLFEAFSQEESGYTRKYEGNGIGLTLVKYYCAINNAEISVESQKNVGSTFKIIFN